MNMGAAGAGLATAISNTAGTLFFLLCLLRRSSTVLSLRPCHLKRTGVYIREILSIGFPSALQYALTVVSLAVLSLFVSKYAVEAVAAYGIVKSWTICRCTFAGHLGGAAALPVLQLCLRRPGTAAAGLCLRRQHHRGLLAGVRYRV